MSGADRDDGIEMGWVCDATISSSEAINCGDVLPVEQ